MMADRRVWVSRTLSKDQRGLKHELRHTLAHPAAAAERQGYVQNAFYRLLMTVELVPDGRGRVLELGANPYFLTLLLKRARAYELSLANFFGETGERVETVMNGITGERHEFHSQQFNVEEDDFP